VSDFTAVVAAGPAAPLLCARRALALARRLTVRFGGARTTGGTPVPRPGRKRAVLLTAVLATPTGAAPSGGFQACARVRNGASSAP